MFDARTRATAVATCLLLVQVAACASNPQPAPATPATATPASPSQQEAAAQIDQAMQREAPGQPTQRVALADGSISLLMTGEQATSPTLVPDTDIYETHSMLDGKPMQCLVSSDRRDVAAALSKIAKDTLGSMERYEFQSIEANAVEGRPYLLAGALYRALVEGRPIVGHFKLAAGTLNGGTLICYFDAPGLRATFADAFRAALASLDTPGIRSAPQPTYEEISIASLDGLITGIDHTIETVERKELTTVLYSYTLARVQGGGISATDSVKVSRSRNGVVQSEKNVNAEDGETDRNLELTLHGRDRYEVTGTLQGKAHQASFRVPGGLLDDHEEAKRLLALSRREEGATDEIASFMPSINPSEVVVQRATRLPSSDPFTVSVHIQSMELRITVDAHGRAESGALALGGRQLQMRRIYEHGQP